MTSSHRNHHRPKDQPSPIRENPARSRPEVTLAQLEPAGPGPDRGLKLSVVVPAFNEEKLLRPCLRSIRDAWERSGPRGWTYEVVVCDNASTDRTAAIGAEEGARVVAEPHRQISRSRNTGARAATGDWLLFLDADSILAPETLAAVLDTASAGRHVGGGCVITFDPMPLGLRCATAFWNLISRSCRWAAGSFVFCRTDAFREVGGFSEEVYAAEEIILSQALKRWGRPQGLPFTILTGAPHLSSGRKAVLYTPREMVRIIARLALAPWSMLKDRDALFILYDRRR